MKSIVGSCMLGILSLLSIGYAQSDPEAKAILDKVSDTYQSYKIIQADFVFSVDHPQQATSSTNGSLLLENASGKYKVALGDQEFISDGKMQWTVMKGQDEVQINTVDDSNSSIGPTTIFTFYKEGYKSVSTGSATVGNQSLYTLELVPLDTKQNVFKIKMRINKANHLIYDATVFDKSGSRYTYIIKNTVANKAIPATTFVFNKSNYPGMEIVDLR